MISGMVLLEFRDPAPPSGILVLAMSSKLHEFDTEERKMCKTITRIKVRRVKAVRLSLITFKSLCFN